MCDYVSESDSKFLSTPSARRATSNTCGSSSSCLRFLSTPSARRATQLTTSRAVALNDFYPRPPRGGRRAYAASTMQPQKISIHALREEGDAGWSYGLGLRYISIHALREEGDGIWKKPGFMLSGFLSTPSARRATP